mmetsp:Transcript_16746/g.28079  ORF Transcript_16746/g.28079 Transcript_16746/m.28079 type:complete len:531 (-) Transcript_16746:1223-2815(-)
MAVNQTPSDYPESLDCMLPPGSASHSSSTMDTTGNDSEFQRLLGRRNLLLCPKSFGSPLYLNFIWFSMFYAILHGTVDAVLAFSAAELGNFVGAVGGFALYIFYTCSALVFAKPFLGIYGPKMSVLFGLSNLLVYVAFFYVAVIFRNIAAPVFVIGSAIGGCGAGILWTAQGSYYAINAEQYAQEEALDKEKVLTNFAAIFASFYLSSEACFKLVATAIYLGEKDTGHADWRGAVFGMYTVTSFASLVLFAYLTSSLTEGKRGASSTELGVTLAVYPGGCRKRVTDTGRREPTENSTTVNHTCDSEASNPQLNNETVGASYVHSFQWPELLHDMGAVLSMLSSNKLLLYIVPYQLCFGLNAGFMNTYITGVVVNDYIGDGYIGLLSGLAIIAAVLLAGPYAYISNRYSDGKMFIMVFGALCFAFAGLTVLVMTNRNIAQWDFIVPFFLIHGAARGVWENTNKSIIADYFTLQDERETAYASVYFSSGFAGAMGFLLSNYLQRDALAAVNVGFSILALLTFLISYWLNKDS